MNRFVISSILLCVGLVGWRVAQAEEPRLPVSDPQMVVEKQLLQKMQKKVDASFLEVPLRDCLDYLEKALDIPIYLDQPALAEEGIDPDSEVWLEVENVTGEMALDSLLRSRNLTWVIQDEVVMITTKMAAQEVREYGSTRVYNVSPLVKSSLTPMEPGAFCLHFSYEGGLWDYDHTQLIECLQSETPGPWLDIHGDGGTVSELNEFLVIRQTFDNQRLIEAILNRLEQLAASPPRLQAVPARTTTYPYAMDEAIQKELQKKTQWEFVEVELRDVTQFLSALHHIQIDFDTRAMKDHFPGKNLLETPITHSVKDISLQSALKLMLQPLELMAIVDRGRILITPAYDEEDIARFGSTVIYDIRPLHLDDVIQVISMLQSETPGPWLDIDGAGGTISELGTNFLVIRQTSKNHAEILQLLQKVTPQLPAETPAKEPKPEQAEPPLDADGQQQILYTVCDEKLAADLMTALPELIAPQTWKTHGGKGVITKTGPAIVIRQTPEVHQEIHAWLKRYFQRVGNPSFYPQSGNPWSF